jgi:hypothetical protein
LIPDFFTLLQQQYHTRAQQLSVYRNFYARLLKTFWVALPAGVSSQSMYVMVHALI